MKKAEMLVKYTGKTNNYPKLTILVHFLVNRYREFTKSSERGYSVL